MLFAVYSVQYHWNIFGTSVIEVTIEVTEVTMGDDASSPQSSSKFPVFEQESPIFGPNVGEVTK